MMEGCCSRFTAAEGGARLAAAAATKNILAVEYASFIPVRLLYEKAFQIRGALNDGKKRSVYITRATRVQVVAFELKILTDLGTVAAQAYEDVEDWQTELNTKEVIICTSSVLKRILEEQLLNMININVLIVDSCHLIYRDNDLKYIMKSYKQCPQEHQPTILALTYPLFTPNKKDIPEEKDNFEKDTSVIKDETGTQDEDRQRKKETQDAQSGLLRKKEMEDKSMDEKEMDDASGALPRMTITKYEEMGLYENVDDFDMYEKLEWKIEELEQELCCQMDLAEDIDGGKRISSTAKPRELIIEYSGRPSDDQLPEVYLQLEKYMRDTVQDALDFIEDHRHDPTEIYGEEMYDEFMSIPDPTIDPKNIFKQFLYVLEQLGPFAADKAAVCLLTKLEKLKIKIPYERHFILMCLCTTVFIKIRCYTELIFDTIEDDWERIKTFSSPKILRFAEILEKFKPPDSRNSNYLRPDTKDEETVVGCDINKENIKKMLNDIEDCDFKSLGNKILDRVNTYESNLKDLESSTDDYSSSFNTADSQTDKANNQKNETDNPKNKTDSQNKSEITNDSPNIPLNTALSEMDTADKDEYSINKTDSQADSQPDTQASGVDIRANELMVQQRGLLGFTRRSGYRLRGRTRLQRSTAARALQMQQNPDALCGIVYMKEPLIAKVMCAVMVDMSNSNNDLSYISAQYCATETPADPSTEPRECQRQSKRQEDVLKKFRMHECNLLLATSALEEGIDLPRCNLVLRWDIPVSYRSYGLCRGRARATRSAAALLCSDNQDTTQMLLHNVATYRELDQIISRKCGCGIQDEPPQSEEDHADVFTHFIKPYCPSDTASTATTAHITQKNHLEDTMKTQDSTCKDTDGTTNSKVKRKKKSKSKRKKDAEETATVKDREEVEKEIKKNREDICFDNNFSTNDGNNSEIKDNSKIIIKDHEDITLTNRKVNKAMEIVNDTINTVNDAINTVNEVIKSDGMDELIDQMENLTAIGGFQTEIMKPQQNSETGEIEEADNVLEVDSKEKILETSNGDPNKSPKLVFVFSNNENSGFYDLSRNNRCSDTSFAPWKGISFNKPFPEQNTRVTGIGNNSSGNIENTSKKMKITDTKDFDTQGVEDIENLTLTENKNLDSLNINSEDIKNTTKHIENIENSTTAESKDLDTENTSSDNTPNTKKRVTVIDPINIDSQNTENIENTTEQVTISDTKRVRVTGTNLDTQNNSSNSTTKRVTVTDTKNPISEGFSTPEDCESNPYCNKCYNIKINGVCVCTNANLYCQMMSKGSLKEGRRNGGESEGAASVDLSSAIALINRYCGKLPSDTFTRLAPQWWMEEVELSLPGSEETRTAYICTLRLPLNCPVNYNIVGHPMPTKVLARRMVALQACRILHKSGELDNQLMPIGKENFKAVELEAVNTICPYIGGENDAHDSARPGSTKRRQYYYKRTAWAFTDCQPIIDTTDAEIYPGQDPETIDIESDVEAPKKEGGKKEKHKEGKVKEGTEKKRNMLYAIVSKLWCALPERYNTRGRRLHAPQLASQAIGILMSRHEPDSLQIPSFPVYTRSGEVRVSVEHVPDADVRMSPRRAKLVRRFMRFVFAEVLRVRRRGMKLQSEGSTHNNYYIVPTIKTTQQDGSTKIDIDWSFLELIYQHTEEKKLTEIEKPIIWQETVEDEKTEKGDRKKKGKKRMANPLLKNGEVFVFDAEKYKEAVVTPWYRNQDQPQFFLVAEICWNLTPDSSFPSAVHQSFRDYYSTKYGVTLTQREQPLLDVDHTSARLNLLTPRYVNRKGVALPVSSERTRRAKRDRLDQKQILIPELCRVHPFAAPLWFATVALPCVLYRINALLIADEIRRAVAIDVGLGIPKINDKVTPKFQWPPLDFGWSLAEVLSQDSEKHEKRKEDDESKKDDKESGEKAEKSDGEEDSTEEKSDAEEVKEKTINEILQEKEQAAAEAAFEIGTWSNDMASSIPETSEYDDLREPLPPNLTFCTSASGGTNWCEPITRHKISHYSGGHNFNMADSDDSFMSSDLDSDDTDLDFEGSDEETDMSGFSGSKNTNTTMGVRIEYKTAHEAEAFDIEKTKKVNPAPIPDTMDDAEDREAHDELIRQGSAPQEYIEKFRASVTQHKQDILEKSHLITKEEFITEILPESKESYQNSVICLKTEQDTIKELFPYGTKELTVKNGQIDVESIERNKRVLLAELKTKLPVEKIKKLNCFSMKDVNIDDEGYVNEKIVNVGFDKKEGYEKIAKSDGEFEPYYADFSPLPSHLSGKDFDFDYQPTLEGHPGPSPSVILQALTMSNANDGINLERLETIGDSFLKFAITAYLYCAHPTVHEGKLSHMRSKQVSNLNLYRLGRNKRLGARMIASKFEPHDNWLPPCHKPPPTLHPRINGEGKDIMQHLDTPMDSAGCFIPYNLITQHSIPDKSIADCVEALIGAYLLECGPRGALLFMSWLGIRVLPCHHVPLDEEHPYVKRVKDESSTTSPSPDRKRTSSSSSSSSCSDDESPPTQEMFPEEDWSWPARAVGSLQPYKDSQGKWMQPIFGELKAPPSPLLRYIDDPEGELNRMLSGYEALEETLQYRFKDRSLLLQALTHASHHSNRLTDCYQRLEFLGDAILDYLITRHLYEDPRRHSPGALTDLRSALVNNTIFATLAARHGFHKYFRHMSPGLNEVLTKYVKIQEENGHSISEEHYLIQEDEMEQAEDVEVPKALGDLFESVAGAIFLDSGMSLGAVWKSYVNLMGAELEAFSAAAPKSPVRELLEAEPDTAKFGKPERLADGRRVRVCVEVFGRGTFKGVGRNYRIAKGTAARCALRHLKGAARADN